jgi:hypothetical protein
MSAPTAPTTADPSTAPRQAYEGADGTRFVPGVVGRDGAIRPDGSPPWGTVGWRVPVPGSPVETPVPEKSRLAVVLEHHVDPDSAEGIADMRRRRISDDPVKARREAFREWLLAPFVQAQEAFRDHPAYREWQRREADLQAAREALAAMPDRIEKAAEAVRKALAARKDPRKAEADKATAEAEQQALGQRLGTLAELAAQEKAEAEQALAAVLVELRNRTVERYRSERDKLDAEIKAFQAERQERMSLAAHVLNELYVDPRLLRMGDQEELGIVHRLCKLPAPQGTEAP